MVKTTLINIQSQNLGYSIRRYFVDEFHFRHVAEIASGSRVLDLGGHKTRKRGQFNIEHYDLRIFYSNLSADKGTDVQADAEVAPFKDDCFDAVICSELLEHVADPIAVLQEINRVLRQHGTLLICAPFLYRIHGDPYDYCRYTDQYWQKKLAKIGFENIQIRRHGLFWSVWVDMIRELVYQLRKEGLPKLVPLQRAVDALVGWGLRHALKRDSQTTSVRYLFFSSYTTGFGIKAIKSVTI